MQEKEEIFSSDQRDLLGFWKQAVVAIAVLASLYHVYALGFEATGMWELRVIHLLVALLLAPMLYKFRASSPEHRISWLDMLFLVLGIVISIYCLIEEDGLSWREDVAPTTADIVFGTMLFVLVLDITRRVVGWPLVVLTLCFLVYAMTASYFPGALKSKSYPFSRIISHILSIDGFYGIPIGVSATFVFLFVLFGAFLRGSRVGDFFIELSYALAGRTRGGPAKVAIFASALMGTMQGSGISNVVTTGTLTIPLMKKTGFQPNFAAAVEAAASTGGQIMPPVMGAAAFLLAGMISIPYSEVVVAAAIPAVLFYVALYMQIDIQAAKWGLKGLSSAQLPPFKQVFKQWGHLSIPIAVLLYMLLIEALSPIRAALWSTLTCVLVSWVKKESRMNLSAIMKALKDGALGSLSVIVACGCAGIVVGLVSLTGIGIKLSSAIVMMSGGHLFVALILTMTITIILSMGLPTTGAYIIAAVVMGPALAKFGISNLQAHLFIFYFACMSAVTPPVALVAYPAAGIAGGDPIKVGFIAWRLCLVAFIVPFMFVYSPALIFVGSYAQIIWSTITAVLGVYLLTAGTSGWFWGQTTPFWQNAVFLAASLALIHSGIVTDLIGLAVLMIFAFLRFYEVKSGRAEGKI